MRASIFAPSNRGRLVDIPAYPSLKTCPQPFEQTITEMKIGMRISTSYCPRRSLYPCARVQAWKYGWVDVCKYASRHISPPLYKEGHIPQSGSMFSYRNTLSYACPEIYSLTDSFPYLPFQGNKPRRACAFPHIYVEPLNRK
ncbi:hypothetical protein PGJ_00011860 [Porphyromonas gingivalis AJW4]|nr:hypothetical protein PGJ_00011860 [Porphyromonas gingivalis AJW4]